MIVLVFFVAITYAANVGEYAPPSPGDSRSPCPGLNALANMGYLPRDGRGISPEMIQQAALEAYGLSVDLVKIATDNALETGVFRGGLLTLGDLSGTHNVIEHDVSLTRLDKGVGEYVKPNVALIDELLSQRDGDFITTSDIVLHRRKQFMRSKSGTPGFTWRLFGGGKQIPVAAGESSFIDLIFSRDGQINKAQLYDWLRYERIPYALGWTKESISKWQFIRKVIFFSTESVIDLGYERVAASREALRASVKYLRDSLSKY